MNIHSLESFGTVDGPGIRFVVFLQGCPLRCLFCHNPDTWQVCREGELPPQSGGSGRGTWTPQELLDEVLRYKSFIKSGGVTCTGGEPLLQAREVAEFFRLCHAKGLHTCLDTSGAVTCDPDTEAGRNVRDLLAETDLVMLDIKAFDSAEGAGDADELHTRLAGQTSTNNRRFLDYLEELHKPTWIRHVVVPAIPAREDRPAEVLTDDGSRLHALAAHVSRYSCVEKVEILPYHTMGVAKYESLGIPYPLEGVPPLSAERAAAVRALFRQHVHCPVE